MIIEFDTVSNKKSKLPAPAGTDVISPLKRLHHCRYKNRGNQLIKCFALKYQKLNFLMINAIKEENLELIQLTLS